ncbi:hypothetical protein BCR42DRAFT_407419 [Absidia repens]|uniref:Uncharacterized protein n=1 Tax=Absidia repens TaxID=90262 RepID=A0A1X2IS47_9FUNG|nr:hypothetical protein BCR42DRAFT_407419 [Absidia repens]
MADSLFNEAAQPNSYDNLFLVNTAKPQASPLEIQLTNDEQQSILPLGKALNMLLHVKTHVLATGMNQTWRSPKKLPSTLTGSPVNTALNSLDLYLTQHSSDFFLRHIYDPLKDKVLKPKNGKEAISNSLQLLAGLTLWSPHRTRYQQWIEQELTHTDKRGALSSALILSFITKQWHPFKENDDDGDDKEQSDQMEQVVMMMTRYFSPLMTVLKQYGELPTLLACTAYDTLLTISVFMVDICLSPVAIIMDQEHGKESTSNAKISVLEDETKDQVDGERLKLIQDVWLRLDSLLVMVEKWQQPTDLITNGAWRELHVFMTQAHHVLLEGRLDRCRQIRKSWCWLSKVLVSSQILSKNPTKKMSFIWKLEDKCLEPNLSSYLKMLMLALRQNGHWIEHQNAKSSPSGLTDDEQNLQEHARVYCRSMIECYPMPDPWTELNQTMIPIIMATVPHLYLPCHIPLPVFSIVLNFPWDASGDGGELDVLTLADCFLPLSHDAIHLLVSKIQPDNWWESGATIGHQDQATSKLSCDILDALISKESKSCSSTCSIFEPLAEELMNRVFMSNKSCELLLRCLPFIRKSVLLLSLIKKLVTADNERTNHVAKGLIAKTLLEDSWCGDSVLVYIDLVREFLRTRRHQTTFICMAMTKCATPDDIYHIYDDSGRNAWFVFIYLFLLELGNMEIELLWPIQLWSSKVDSAILEKIIPLLINKYYNTPSESIFIHVWQMLAHTITQRKSLMLAIITKCTDIMENQKSLFEMIRRGIIHKDDINFFTLLLPILILSIFPKQAYEYVGLPSSIIQKWHGRWPHFNDERKCKKAELTTMDENESKLYIRLADELLLRYDYSEQINGIHQIRKLTSDTLYKIFYYE